MNGYISREAAITALCHVCSRSGVCLPGDSCVAYEKIKSLPAADVRPMESGKWELTTLDDGYGEYQLYQCDKCGELTAQRRNFCPNCGAEMKEDV